MKKLIFFIIAMVVCITFQSFAEHDKIIISDEPVIVNPGNSIPTIIVDPFVPFITEEEKITSAEEKLMEGFVYSESVPLSKELQEHLWKVCKQKGIKYCFALGTIELESSFNQNAKHKNSNGTTDRGLTQVNSCNIKKLKKLGLISSTEDLFNPYISINCGMQILSEYVEKFGNTEKAYAAYNTGNEKINSNKNSRAVMRYWDCWKKILGDI